MTGLPSLRALDQAQDARIWLAAEAADMRCGFDRLAERVRALSLLGSALLPPLRGLLCVSRLSTRLAPWAIVSRPSG